MNTKYIISEFCHAIVDENVVVLCNTGNGKVKKFHFNVEKLFNSILMIIALLKSVTQLQQRKIKNIYNLPFI